MEEEKKKEGKKFNISFRKAIFWGLVAHAGYWVVVQHQPGSNTFTKLGATVDRISFEQALNYVDDGLSRIKGGPPVDLVSDRFQSPDATNFGMIGDPTIVRAYSALMDKTGIVNDTKEIVSALSTTMIQPQLMLEEDLTEREVQRQAAGELFREKITTARIARLVVGDLSAYLTPAEAEAVVAFMSTSAGEKYNDFRRHVSMGQVFYLEQILE